MDTDLEEKIRQRAYEIWEREGRSGAPLDHWREAQRELIGASSTGIDLSSDQDKPADAILTIAGVAPGSG